MCPAVNSQRTEVSNQLLLIPEPRKTGKVLVLHWKELVFEYFKPMSNGWGSSFRYYYAHLKRLFYLTATYLVRRNKCSVGPETSISPSGKGQGPTSFSERGLFFSEIGKEQSSRGKGNGRDLFNRGYTCFMPYRYIFSTSQTSWPQPKVYEIMILVIWKPWGYSLRSKITQFWD